MKKIVDMDTFGATRSAVHDFCLDLAQEMERRTRESWPRVLTFDPWQWELSSSGDRCRFEAAILLPVPLPMLDLGAWFRSKFRAISSPGSLVVVRPVGREATVARVSVISVTTRVAACATCIRSGCVKKAV